jgi:hypothetical protein
MNQNQRRIVDVQTFLETRTPGNKKNPDNHLTLESKATKIIHLFPSSQLA